MKKDILDTEKISFEEFILTCIEVNQLEKKISKQIAEMDSIFQQIIDLEKSRSIKRGTKK